MRKRLINTTMPTDWACLQDAMNLSGMTRCSIYKLLRLANGEIENALVCGRRLINLKSLNAYLSKLSKEQARVDKPGLTVEEAK
jgi:hypothetical protein